MITIMTSGVRTLMAQHAVADVEDLDAAISDDSVGPEIRHRLAAVRDRRLTEVPGVPVSVAAGVLGLSAQSVRAWLDAGVLEAVPGSQPLQVTTPRLVLVVSLLHRLRRAGRDRDLLRAVVDRLEDDRVRQGQVEAFSAEDL